MTRRFSYSDRNLYKQCPQKYFRIKVARDVKDVFRGPAATKGTEVHADLETALERDRALPARSIEATWALDYVRALTGLKMPERFYSVDAQIAPVGRGGAVFNTAKVDVTVLRAADADVVDYKTGKHNADTTQLRDSAVMIMAFYPTVVRVKGHLLFTHTEGLVETETFTREHIMDYVADWFDVRDDVADAERMNNWPMQPSGLCPYCPCTGCEQHPGVQR